MLALAIIAAVFGLVAGTRVRLLGLVVTTTLTGMASFLPQFHPEPSLERYVTGFVVAVVVHQLAALLAMLIRYLTFRRPVAGTRTPAGYPQGIKSEARARN